MIHPMMYALYLCYLGEEHIGKSFRNYSESRINYGLREAIRNLAHMKKWECRTSFFLEGELAWEKLTDRSIGLFIEQYGEKNGS